jgi:hypothetical protein
MMSSDDTRTGNSVAETAYSDLEPETPRVAHEWDSTDSLLLRIIETVAEETGQAHDEMAPLHSAVDPDALERLLTGSESFLRLTFTYEGCTITAANDGTVVVQPE